MYGRVFIDEWWQWFGRLREKWVNSNRNFSILLDLIPWKKMKKEMELSTHGFTLDLASQVAMVESGEYTHNKIKTILPRENVT